MWTFFAAAVAAQPVRWNGVDDFTGTDQEFIENFFVPGIQRAGGLAAARALVGR
jgi:hypothetical protein